jgi:hypothetical protein
VTVKRLDLIREGERVIVCDHVALEGAAWSPHPQVPPARAVDRAGHALQVQVVLLCRTCARDPPAVGDDAFLAVMRGGRPAPA